MFTLLGKVFVLSILLHCSIVYSDDVKDESLDRVGLWFGPRLGKRMMRPNNIDNRQAIIKLLEAAEAVKYYYDQLPYYETALDEPDREKKKSSKVVFTPILGRSLNEYEKRADNMDFTPRLGRRVSDDMPATPPEQEVYQPDAEPVEGHAKYFSPRLGRTMSFSPRLGRELHYALTPNKQRFARSINKTAQP